jgi:hypothetical protein
MSKAFTPERVLNGTFGEVWLDGTYLPQATGLEAKYSLDKEEVHQCKKLSKGYKITGTDGKGTLKLNKVDSTMLDLIGPDLQSGKLTQHTIISKVDDPDAWGGERIQLEGVVFDELTIADWELKKLMTESIGFTFSGFTALDTIDPE